MIEHHDNDSVSFRITAFSRPARRLARIAGPLGAVVQRQITAAYLRSLAKIVVQLAITSGGMVALRENPGRCGSRRAGAAAALRLGLCCAAGVRGGTVGAGCP